MTDDAGLVPALAMASGYDALLTPDAVAAACAAGRVTPTATPATAVAVGAPTAGTGAATSPTAAARPDRRAEPIGWQEWADSRAVIATPEPDLDPVLRPRAYVPGPVPAPARPATSASTAMSTAASTAASTTSRRRT